MSRLAVLTPFAFPSVRGNAITVGRIVEGLRSRGLEVRVWDLSVTDGERSTAGTRQDRRRSTARRVVARERGPIRQFTQGTP